MWRGEICEALELWNTRGDHEINNRIEWIGCCRGKNVALWLKSNCVAVGVIAVYHWWCCSYTAAPFHFDEFIERLMWHSIVAQEYSFNILNISMKNSCQNNSEKGAYSGAGIAGRQYFSGVTLVEMCENWNPWITANFLVRIYRCIWTTWTTPCCCSLYFVRLSNMHVRCGLDEVVQNLLLD